MDAPAFTVENIEKALHQLYYDPVPSTKDTAQRWLMYAQRSKQAWSFAWELLKENRPTEVRYFGASALVSKISGSWNEIPEEEIDALRNRLYSEILHLCVSSQDRIILTRVCVAFSMFVMHCTVMKKWDSPVYDIIKKLQDEDGAASAVQRCSALLEILTVLPEEFQSRNIEKYNKSIVKHMLIEGIPHVLPLLSNLLSTESIKQLHDKVLKAIASWIVVGVPLNEHKDLLIKILDKTENSELFENCVECLLKAFCSPNAFMYRNTIKELIPKVIALRPLFHRAIEEQDNDVCIGITKLVCGLAENQTKMIVENYTEIGLSLIYFIAECTGIKLQYPTEEMGSPITFTFWYSLQDDVKSLPETESSILPLIQPVYYHLVETLVRKASYPADGSHTDWTSDEKEQHRIYRIDVSDTLMYVLEMLGPPMIHFLCEKLAHVVNVMKSHQESHWQESEAYLFGIQSVVESLSEWETEADCLNGLVHLLPTIPLSNVTLADTILYTIGALTEWLVYHPQYISILLPIVLPCLHNTDLALSTVLTLKRITRECDLHMQPYANMILGTIQDALVKGILKTNEIHWIMQAAGHVLSILPDDECLNQLESVLMLHMHQLKALAEDPPTGPTKNSIVHILDILTNLFSTLNRCKDDEDGKTVAPPSDKQPVLLILQQITPILQEILNCWISDTSVVRSICDLYDRSIRNLISGFSPLVETLCHMLAKIYQTVPQISVLELTEQLVLVYGTDHELSVGTLLRSLIETSRKFFEGGYARNHPDLPQGFVKLLSHTIKKKFKLLLEIKHSSEALALSPVDFSLLFQCGLATMSLPESESVKSACNFYTELLACYPTHPEVAIVVNQLGKELLAVALKAVGGQAPRTVMDHVSDVIFSLSKVNFQLFVIWINELRTMQDIPSLTVDRNKEETFMNQLLRERSSKRRFRELVKEFTLVCRGLHGTEYAMG